MKQLISFSLALCSIVLMAFFSSPSYGGESKTIKKTELSASYGHFDYHERIYNAVFGSGMLPDRISIPDPAVIHIQDLKNDRSRGKENRELKGKLRTDKETKLKI